MARVLVRDIMYTDYYNHYIQIHTSNRMIKTYMSFAEFSPLLFKIQTVHQSLPQLYDQYGLCPADG